jgi:phosphate-selective porin OprO/OprP
VEQISTGGKHAMPIIATVVALMTLAGTALAQSRTAPTSDHKDEEIQELKTEIKQLEQRVQAVEGLGSQVKEVSRKVEVDEQAQQDWNATLPKVKAGVDGFWLDSPDNAYKLHLNGYVQGVSRFYTSQEPAGAPSTFVMRRVRPIFEGTVAKYYDFRIMPDFGGGNTTLYDAWGNIHYWDQLQLKIGKFKEPVGIERLQEDKWLFLVERGLPSDLMADRDIGAQLFGTLFDNRVEWYAGVFNGVPDNTATVDADVNSPKDFVARLFLHPFHHTEVTLLDGLGVGIAGSYGDERGTTIDTFKSTFQNIFFAFNSNVLASGSRYRFSPQMNYYHGPIGFFSEFVQNGQALGAIKTAPKTKPKTKYTTLTNSAWQVVGSYVLTGENATYNGVTPREDFSPFGGGGWGALELAARVGELEIDHKAYALGFANPANSARTDFEWAFGFNWYLNRNVKFVLNYDLNSFTGGARAGHNRPKENGVDTLFQVQF